MMLDKAKFCIQLIKMLVNEEFGNNVNIDKIMGFDGNPPAESNNYCCVDATEELSEFRGLVEIDGQMICFMAQINSKDQHRSKFIPAHQVLDDPSGQPRKTQEIIQKMILGRKKGVMLIPDNEDDAVDVIGGLVEQGFPELASQYRDFIIRQLEKSKSK